MTNRRVISPLVGLFVITGLGQIINNQTRKGLILIGAMLAYNIGVAALVSQWPETFATYFLLVAYLIGVFAIVIYGAVDAYQVGKRLDMEAIARFGQSPPRGGMAVMDPPPEDRPRPAPGL